MSSDFRVLNSRCQRNSIENENSSAFKRKDRGDKNLHKDIYRVKHTCQRKDQCGWNRISGAGRLMLSHYTSDIQSFS